MIRRRHRIVAPPSRAHLWLLGTLVALLCISAKLGSHVRAEAPAETQAHHAHLSLRQLP